jgi:predicted nucleic acid-binding protein
VGAIASVVARLRPADAVSDSWIAATAIALGVEIVTQDDDYVDVSGLLVIKA